MSLFLSDAVAATSSSAAQQQSGLSMLIMPLAFLLIFYFMLWRPQSKRAKEQREMLDSLRKGDEIITSGGVLGKVSEVGEKFLTISIAENVEIKLQRSAINSVLPKGTIKSS